MKQKKRKENAQLSEGSQNEIEALTHFCSGIFSLANSKSLGGMVDKMGDALQSMTEGNTFFSQIMEVSREEEDLEKLYFRGHTLYTQGDYEQAETIFLNLSALSPFEPRYIFALAAAQENNDNYELAIKSYWKAVLLDKKRVESYYRVAKCYLKLNKLRLAKEALKTFISKAKKKKKQKTLLGQANLLLKGILNMEKAEKSAKKKKKTKKKTTGRKKKE